MAVSIGSLLPYGTGICLLLCVCISGLFYFIVSLDLFLSRLVQGTYSPLPFPRSFCLSACRPHALWAGFPLSVSCLFLPQPVFLCLFPSFFCHSLFSALLVMIDTDSVSQQNTFILICNLMPRCPVFAERLSQTSFN